MSNPVPYPGIYPDVFLLLAENRFRNSKEFYEAHKQEIKNGIILPMENIAAHLSDQLAKLDDQMNLIPSRMHCRIRRDNRFTHDKSMYRDHIWMMFMRHKSVCGVYPAMWFEVTAQGWSCGICVYDPTPAYMEFLRNRLPGMEEQFVSAVKKAKRVGAQPSWDTYRRPKAPDAPKDLYSFMNCKSFHFMRFSTDLTILQSDAILTQLKSCISAFSPLYRILRELADEFTSMQMNDQISSERKQSYELSDF